VFSSLKYSIHYSFMEKHIKKALGPGFFYKEVTFKGDGFRVIVQFKGVKYYILTKQKQLLMFEPI